MERKQSPSHLPRDLQINVPEPQPGSTKNLNLDLSSVDKINEIFEQVKSLHKLTQKVFKDFESNEERLDKNTQECFGKKQRVEKLIKSINIFSPTNKQRTDQICQDITTNYNHVKEAIVISNVTLKQIDSLVKKLQLFDQMLYEVNQSYLDLFKTYKLDPGPQQKQLTYQYKGAVPVQHSPTYKPLIQPFMMQSEDQYIIEKNPILESLLKEGIQFQHGEQSQTYNNLIYSLVKVTDDLILNGVDELTLAVLDQKTFNVKKSIQHEFGHLFSGLPIGNNAYLGMSKGLVEFNIETQTFKRHYPTQGLLFSVCKINNTQLLLGSAFRAQGNLEMFQIKSFSSMQQVEVDSGIFQLQQLSNEKMDFGLATRRGLQVAQVDDNGELKILEEKYSVGSAVPSFVVMSEILIAVCTPKGIVIVNREKKRKIKQIGQYEIRGPIGIFTIPTVNPAQFALIRDYQGISLIDFKEERIKLLFRCDYQDIQNLSQQVLTEKVGNELEIVVIEHSGQQSKIVRRKLQNQQ